ncbi:MAG: translation initiation factor IF-3, partial [Maribacter sp.]
MAKRFKRNNRQERERPQHRLNSQIRVPEVRLVGDDMEAISEAAGKTIDP